MLLKSSLLFGAAGIDALDAAVMGLVPTMIVRRVIKRVLWV
jgi:hypothetical protein